MKTKLRLTLDVEYEGDNLEAMKYDLENLVEYGDYNGLLNLTSDAEFEVRFYKVEETK